MTSIEEMAARIAALEDALTTTIDRVEDASNMFHNSRQWHEEDAPDGGGTLWDWVFAHARAASADTLPKGQDAQQGLAGTESGAVGNAETPKPSRGTDHG